MILGAGFGRPLAIRQVEGAQALRPGSELAMSEPSLLLGAPIRLGYQQDCEKFLLAALPHLGYSPGVERRSVVLDVDSSNQN